MKRPLIGISGPDRGGLAAWWFTALAVRLQGGRARRITPARPFKVELLQGLIIGGGADIDPGWKELSREIGKVRDAVRQTGGRQWLAWILYPFIYLIRRLFSSKHSAQYDKHRDHLEFALLQQAVGKKLPVLGICRGAQLINVFLDGSLHEDIQEFYEESPLPRSIFPVKKISVEKGTLLHEILSRDSCSVNALHHQAIKTPGQDIRISARESNGIIQAIESAQQPFLLGVQWHPEYLPMESVQRRIFRALVAAASEHPPGGGSD